MSIAKLLQCDVRHGLTSPYGDIIKALVLARLEIHP
jgi:hypothetical protein